VAYSRLVRAPTAELHGPLRFGPANRRRFRPAGFSEYVSIGSKNRHKADRMEKGAGKILITGGGGFIGGHLVAEFIRQGYTDIRVVDCKPFTDWHQIFPQVENVSADLRELPACRAAVRDSRWVFNLAADMGGMGFIETHKAECMLSVLISTHVLMAAREAAVGRLFYSSSACVYAAEKQTSADVVALRESDAYPAMPEDGYGWEKLFSERMCRHFHEDYGLATRVARYHNVYGPHGTFDGGREKAPAAICRKVIAAKRDLGRRPADPQLYVCR
jgi:GDP-D-mannose 3', 5'-epimerase